MQDWLNPFFSRNGTHRGKGPPGRYLRESGFRRELVKLVGSTFSNLFTGLGHTRGFSRADTSSRKKEERSPSPIFLRCFTSPRPSVLRFDLFAVLELYSGPEVVIMFPKPVPIYSSMRIIENYC